MYFGDEIVHRVALLIYCKTRFWVRDRTPEVTIPRKQIVHLYR